MRCEDLTRELASPTGHLSQAEMAGHLAHCPSCAEWSRRAAHFDQIWEATRPPEPSEATLDALWAGASDAIGARSVPATLRLEGLTHRRRSWMKPAFMVAQAAAILIVAVVLFRQGNVKPVEIADAMPVKEDVEVTPLKVNVEVGQTALVKIGDNGHQIELLSEPISNSSAIPEFTPFDALNGAEGMLSPGFPSVVSR